MRSSRIHVRVRRGSRVGAAGGRVLVSGVVELALHAEGTFA